MKKIMTSIFIGLISFTVHSQSICNCEDAMGYLISKIESEYPGLEEKTTNKIMYNNFKKQMILKSKDPKIPNCLNLLKEYLDYFHDLHMHIQSQGEIEKNIKKLVSYKKLNVDIKKFTKDIRNTKDPLEGLWEAPNYRLVIIKGKGNIYNGFVVKEGSNGWKLNDVKFTLYKDNKADYFFTDHTIKKMTYSIYKNSIVSFPELNSVFIKKLPKPTLTAEQITKKVIEFEGFEFKELTSKTVYLKIASFDYPYIERIEKLIDDNKSLIENHENLILDLRNNTGGTGLAYQKLKPYIYTNPLRYIHQEFLVTKTLINGLQDYLKKIADDDKYTSDRERIKRNLAMYEGNIGQFINPSKTAVDIETMKKPKHSPSQIVILTNKHVGSSAEVLVLIAKQSKKVKILGTPTNGVIDYASARWFDDFECKNYRLLLPTSRSLRLPDFPLDNIGLQPDVYLDKSVTNWIDFALDYLEN